MLPRAASVRMPSIWVESSPPDVRKARMATLRERLLKIAVRVCSSVRRITLEFPCHHPWREAGLQTARPMGAIPL